MTTNVYARRLFLRTSRRLGSAPVLLACSPRGPRSDTVLLRPGGKKRIPPHRLIRCPASPAQTGTAVPREPKIQHLRVRRQLKAVQSKALIRLVCEMLRICIVIPRKGIANKRVVVATSAAQPPRTPRYHDVNLGRPRALARAPPS